MSTRFYQFGPFRIDMLNHVLLRDGETIPLKPKVFDTLLVLLENRVRVLEKDELMDRLWPATIVEESNLTQNVYLVRKALGEGPRENVYIKTLPKRGYRFVATVNEVVDASADVRVDEHFQARGIVDQKTETEVALKFADAKQAARERPLAGQRWEKQSSWWKLSAVVLAVCIPGLGGAITIALPYFKSKSRSAGKGRSTPVRSIAVLPFMPLRSDAGDEYLGFMMADTLITKLGALKQITVRPTSAVRKFASPNQDPVAAGRDLKVDAVLESSLQRVNDRIRVTVRLVSAVDGSTLWAGHVDEEVNDVFAMQDRVSEQIARALFVIPLLATR